MSAYGHGPLSTIWSRLASADLKLPSVLALARLPSGKVIWISRPAFWVTWATQTMRPSLLTTTPLPPPPTPTVAGTIFSSVFWIFASRARSSESDLGMAGGGALGGGAAPSPDDARMTMTTGRHNVRTVRLMGKGLRIEGSTSRASGARRRAARGIVSAGRVDGWKNHRRLIGRATKWADPAGGIRS